MKPKYLLLIAFVLMVMVQLYVPAKMILGQEDILANGASFKFQTAPVDPEDPFRGRYVVLSFAENQIEQDTGIWQYNEPVYVRFENDEDGFAKIAEVSKKAPDTNDYLKTVAVGIPSRYNNKLLVDYPFDRYYMEESKAPDAEMLYWESRRDTTKRPYALVSIKDGKFALQDVLIDGVSLKDMVESNNKAAGSK